MTRPPHRLLAAALLATTLAGCMGGGDSGPNGGAAIHVVRADGTGLTRLSPDGARDLYPAWSPDGTRLAFVGATDDGSDVHLSGVDGSGRTRLVETTGGDVMPTWSPDGSRLAFVNDQDLLYVVRADGTGVIRIGIGAGGEAIEDAPPMPPSGGAQPGSGGAPSSSPPEHRPAWSPDGRRILYSAWSPDAGTEVWAAGADGSNPTRLSDLPGRDMMAMDPAWSPDGTQVAFVAWGPPPRLYVVGADGTGQRQVGGTVGGAALALGTDPAWSPDGHLILLAVSAPSGGGIYAVPADGSDPAAQLVAAGPASEPAWSPDGARIAYVAASGGVDAAPLKSSDGTSKGSAIVAVQADGPGRVTLADTQGNDLQPAWAPDGGSVAFMSVEIVPSDGD